MHHDAIVGKNYNYELKDTNLRSIFTKPIMDVMT